MKDIYPRYADRVNFIAVGIDPTESLAMLDAYRTTNGYPWTVTQGEGEMLERYQVLTTDIKYAINKNGVITFHKGYGVESAQTWERVFEGLVGD